MRVLGIESSCDDTSVALLDCSQKGYFVLKEKTASQIKIHKKYGGVVPEVAGRMHAEKIIPLIEKILSNLSKGKKIKPNVIAVTAGPGLITGLIVGVEAARTLAYAWNIPLVAVNHIEGHICSVEIRKQKAESRKQGVKYPAIALIASGGHTELILIKKQGQYTLLGKTKDDAAGECFDKVAKLLGLPYPGGPQISKLAEKGNPRAINFPRPMLNNNNFDFSFSGLKTSALYWLEKNAKKKTIGYELLAMNYTDFCASFEQAIIDVLIGKTIKAVLKYQPKTVILGGGVSANKKLRKTLKEELDKNVPSTKYQVPSTKYSMDNASMIAVAGYYKAKQKKFTPWQKIKACPNWDLA